MKVISLNCNHCGAPLEVSAKAKYVTCGFCEANLVVEHTGSSYSTAVLEEIRETTAQLARDVAEIKSSSELEQLDKQWERQRSQHMVTGKHGQQSLPTKTGAVVLGTAMGGFGLLWTLFAGGIVSMGIGSGAPAFIGIFPLFGLIFIGVAVFGAISTYNKADSYERARQRYESQRRQLYQQAEEHEGE